MSYDLIIDEKVEVWRRTHVTVDTDNLDEAIEKCLNYDYDSTCNEILYDTEMAIDPFKENGPTVEIYLNESSSYGPIYTNDPHKK